MENECKERAEPDGGGSDSGCTSASSPLSGPPQTQAEIKVSNAGRALKASFGSAVWMTLAREAHFTHFLAKLASLKLEGVANCDKKLEDDCSTWLEGLVNGKTFIRKWRVFQKDLKHEKLMACNPHFRDFVLFLHSVDIPPHSTMEVWLAKVTFYESVQEQGALCEAVTEFMSTGLIHLPSPTGPAEAESQPATGAPAMDAEVCMRDLVLHALATLMMSATPEEFGEKRMKFGSDIDKTIAAITDDSTKRFESLVADLKHVSLLLHAHAESDDLSASVVTSAVKWVTTSKRMTRMTPFVKSVNGRQLLATADELLVLRAGDDIAIKRLTSAKACLADPKMMALSVNGDEAAGHKYCVNFVDRALDNTVLQSLSESLGLALESMNYFSSTVQFEAQRASFDKWATQFNDLCSLYAHVLLLTWFEAVAPALADLVATCESESDDPLVVAHAAAKLPLQALMAVVDPMRAVSASAETDLNSLVKAVDNFTELKGKMMGATASKEVVEGSARIRVASKLQASLIDMCFALVAMRDVELPSDPAAVVEEWQGHRAASRSNPAFLDAAVALHAAFKHVESQMWQSEDLKKAFAVEEDDMVMLVHDKCDDDANPVLWQGVFDAADEFAKMPLVSGTFLVLSKMEGEVLRRLANSLKLSAMSVGTGFTATQVVEAARSGTSIADLADLIIEARSIGDGMKHFKRHLADPGLDAFVSQGLLDVLNKLTDSGRRCPDGLDFSPMIHSHSSSAAPLPSLPHALAMLQASSGIYVIFLAIGFFKLHGSASHIHQHRLRTTTASAVARLDETTRQTLLLLESPVFDEVEQAGARWLLSVTDMKNILVTASAFCTSIKKSLVRMLIEDASSIAESVSACTPQYAHVVSGNTYHPKLAKKALAQYTSKAKLTAETVALCGAMTATAQIDDKWALQPPMREDPDLTESLSFCSSIYQAAKAALTIIAAVTIIETKKGDDAKNDAKAILSKKKAELQPCLVELLEVVAAGPKQGKAAQAALTLVDSQ